MGIEPTRPAWKAGILAIELHPHLNKKYINTFLAHSQVEKTDFLFNNVIFFKIYRKTVYIVF